MNMTPSSGSGSADGCSVYTFGGEITSGTGFDDVAADVVAASEPGVVKPVQQLQYNHFCVKLLYTNSCVATPAVTCGGCCNDVDDVGDVRTGCR